MTRFTIIYHTRRYFQDPGCPEDMEMSTAYGIAEEFTRDHRSKERWEQELDDKWE